MTLDTFFATLWRRRPLVLASFALGLAVVVAVTLALPKTYRATATLFIGTERGVDAATALDTTLGEQLVRTYTTLAANPNLADAVRREVPGTPSRSALLAKMSFAPVERTRLLEISAEERSPEGAQRLANTYARVFASRVDRRVAADQAPAKITVSEPAALPTTPAKPSKPLYLGLGAVLAALLAAGIALVRDRLDDRLVVGEDQDQLLDLPVVARIPGTIGGRRADPAPVDDAFAVLETNLDFLGPRHARVVLVTSAAPLEGKSTVAARLALAARENGRSVALVEADLRRPRLRAALPGVEAPDARAPGLAAFLAGRADAEEVVVSARPGLDVVWAGLGAVNPGALLHSDRFAALIEHLAARHDRVVVDTPPASIGADASVAARVADVTLFVVDARASRRSSVHAALNQLQIAHARHLGIVVNRAEAPRLGGYGYGRGGRNGRAAERDAGAPSART